MDNKRISPTWPKSGTQDAEDKKWAGMQKIVGADPLPYGLQANIKTIDALIDFASNQKLISKRYTPEELFIPSN